MADEREILTWDLFGTASRELAQRVADDGFEPDIILAIARGGLLIAGALGYALSIKNLVYGGSGDLILNPVGTGALADTIKADAYTKTLTISGPLDPGVANTLTIEVKDGRDAFLDSGLLIKDGSFKTFVMPEVGIGFDPGAGGSGVGGEGASGTIVIGSHDGHITVTPPAGASGPVEVIVTPSDTIEIPGAGGPGKPVIVTFNPGDGPKDVPIQAAPGAGTGDTGTVHYEVVSTDPNVNGQPIAPDVFGFELPANRPPEITSPTGEIHVTENTTNVAQVIAVDPDAGQTLTYSIEGGADKDLFTLDPATGALKFKAAPDFDLRPLDGLTANNAAVPGGYWTNHRSW